jgi:mycothiol synthase
VRPPDRRRGLGGRLLDATETAAARLVAERGVPAAVMLGGNADDGQDDRMALLAGRGYRRTFTMVWMRRDPSPVPRRPLPAGFELRTATVDDAGAWHRLAGRAWAGRPFVVVPSEERLRSWLERSDRSSFLVATAGERVAGFVAISGDEVEDVAVDPDFQRRGLASALLARALERLGGPARLRTEGHDPAGARSLYERFGFRVLSRHHRYRKPLA